MPTADHHIRARAIHDTLPVVDGHNDLAWEIRVRAGGSLQKVDPRQQMNGYHTDLPRLLDGGVGAQFWSVYVPPWSENPLDATLRQIDLIEELVELSQEFTEMAGSASDVERIRSEGRVASLIGAEGGHSLQGSISNVALLRQRGVRYLTLTHGSTNDIGDSATDAPKHDGLSGLGRSVVREMNRTGILVDISHVAPTTMRHALELSEAPVIASHSSAFALAPHPRNLPDDVIEMVAAGGGVVMITFVPAFIVRETAIHALDMFEEERRLRSQFGPDDEAGYAAASEARARAADVDDGSVGDVVDHIEHAVRIGGVDHVGLGSDFDGMIRVPRGLEDVSCYPAITAELLSRGWGEEEVRKVLGGNALRVLRTADEVAA